MAYVILGATQAHSVPYVTEKAATAAIRSGCCWHHLASLMYTRWMLPNTRCNQQPRASKPVHHLCMEGELAVLLHARVGAMWYLLP